MKGGLAGWQVRRVEALANADLSRLTASVLADEVRLSRFHFTRAFRSTMGTTPGRWLTQRRVEQARALLENRHVSVTDAARQVGYRGAPQLTRAFRARYGVAPSIGLPRYRP